MPFCSRSDALILLTAPASLLFAVLAGAFCVSDLVALPVLGGAPGCLFGRQVKSKTRERWSEGNCAEGIQP